MSRSMDFPIDAVYMWVDGDDPEWRRKREKALRNWNGEAVPASSLSGARFRDNDELLYSLRSLERFAPWIRTVHLVTDGQCPMWLNRQRVHLVDHKTILPPEAAYPVFSNRPIEFCLHRIPDLAEHYLAFNDDFMFGNDVLPRDFFTREGNPVVWGARISPRRMDRLCSGLQDGISPHQHSASRAHHLVHERYGVWIPYAIKHYPRAVSRSTFQELCATVCPEERQATLASPFRSYRDMSPFPLYCLYLLASGNGKLRRINGLAQIIGFLHGRVPHIGASLGDDNMEAKIHLIRRLRPLTFCLNDAEHGAAVDASSDRERLRKVLEAYFPNKSCYEL